MCLGSIIDHQGGTDLDITARTCKAKATFIMLCKKHLGLKGNLNILQHLYSFSLTQTFLCHQFEATFTYYFTGYALGLFDPHLQTANSKGWIHCELLRVDDFRRNSATGKYRLQTYMYPECFIPMNRSSIKWWKMLWEKCETKWKCVNTNGKDGFCCSRYVRKMRWGPVSLRVS